MHRSASKPYLILSALWLLIFSSSSQIIIVAPILPRIGEELMISQALLGSLITAYAIMVGVFAIVSGPISDKVGRRAMLLFGSGAMTVALLLHAGAVTFASLLVLRAFAGACGGVLSGAAVAYVGDYFPYARRGWAAGWVMSGVAVGQIVGIPLGTILADLFGFRIPFVMFGGTMAVAFLLIWWAVPQPPVERYSGKLTARGSLMNYLDLIRKSEVAAATFAYLLMFLSLSLYIVYFPIWLENTLRVGGVQIASLFFVGGVAGVITGPLAGKLSDRVGRKPLIIGSCIGLAAVMPPTTFLVLDMWWAYAVFGTIVVMMTIRVSPLQALLTELVPENQRGMLLSLAIAVGQIGIGIGSAASGPAYVEYGFGMVATLAAGSIGLMALVVWLFLPEPDSK